jgi:hypothetical protein
VALIVHIISSSVSLHSQIYAIALTAAISHVLDAVLILATTSDYLRHAKGVLRNTFGAMSILLATLAAVLSVYTFVHLYNTEQHPEVPQIQCQGGFAAWAVTVITHAALYGLIFSPTSGHSSNESSIEDGKNKQAPSISLKRSISLHLTALPQLPRAHFGRSTAQAQPTPEPEPPSAVRRSLDHIIRPMTSRTKLLLQKARDSYSLHSDRKQSSDTKDHEDDFGDWDTSPPYELQKEIYTRPPPVRARLETIPGSRPVSAAKPLDGPFPEEVAEEKQTSIDSTQNEVNQPTTSSSESSSVRRISRRSWDNSPPDQSFIHPLFRSESPQPAPFVSPGTTLYASPLAGRTISPDHELLGQRRMYSTNSFRADSPGPIGPGRSRQNSLQSVRYQQATSGDLLEQIRPSARSRQNSLQSVRYQQASSGDLLEQVRPSGRSRQNSLQSMRYQQASSGDLLEQIRPPLNFSGPAGKS